LRHLSMTSASSSISTSRRNISERGSPSDMQIVLPSSGRREIDLHFAQFE
jgi:hypothetical protein